MSRANTSGAIGRLLFLLVCAGVWPALRLEAFETDAAETRPAAAATAPELAALDESPEPATATTDEEAPGDDAAEAEAGPDAVPTQRTDERPEGPTVDDLIERIDPTAKSPLDEARERLERAIENMRSAKDRLVREDTSADTRSLQSRAVDDLEKLLEALQNPPPSQPNQKQSQSQSQNQNQSRSQNQQRQSKSRQQKKQRKQSSRNRRSQSQRQQQAQRQNQPQPAPGDRSEQPTGAEERTDAARRKAEEEARRRSVADDVWGHLPPSVREALQKSFNEKYLPKYEELVRRYYESLAEQNRGRGRRE